MPMLPVLTTQRLTLQGACQADLDTLWQLLTDPQVRRYLCDNQILSRADVQEMLTASLAQAAQGMGFWMLHDHEGGHVGCIGLHPVLRDIVSHPPHLAGEVEPTIALAPERWGQGLATEALAAVVTYAFETLGLERLVAVVDEPNHASQRLMGRVGFTPTGRSNGPYYPLRIFRLTRAAARRSRRPR
jgi:RimJ/RimL family protein N-acetyltransferase